MIHFIPPTDTPTRLTPKDSTPTLPHAPPFQKGDKTNLVFRNTIYFITQITVRFPT